MVAKLKWYTTEWCLCLNAYLIVAEDQRLSTIQKTRNKGG